MPNRSLLLNGARRRSIRTDAADQLPTGHGAKTLKFEQVLEKRNGHFTAYPYIMDKAIACQEKSKPF